MTPLVAILAVVLIAAVAVIARLWRITNRQHALIDEYVKATTDLVVDHDEQLQVRDDAVNEALEAADQLRAENTVIRRENDDLRDQLDRQLRLAVGEAP